MTIHGAIVRIEPALGFGFLRDDSFGDWFFVTSGIRTSRFDDVPVGARVGFQMERTPSGPRATDVHLESAA